MSELPLIQCTTELEAVNSILASVGESPIDSFSDEFTDARIARDLLAQESRRAQLIGWTVNTEIEYPLVRDVGGKIAVPRNTLRVIFEDNEDVVQRGVYLYDRKRHTDVFLQDLQADLVVALDFESLPESLRQFIVIRAGRRFQDRYQGDATLHKFQRDDEIAAWAAALNYEAEIAQWNVLTQSALNQRLKRFRPYG